MGRNSLLLVVSAAVVLLLYGSGLSHTPPHLHHDEVVIGLQAHSIAATGRDFEGRLLPLYFHMPHVGERAWYQPAIVYLTAVFLQLLPATDVSLRMPTAVVATLDVLLMFFVARRLFGAARWGLVAALLLAATPAHYILGRVAFDFIYPLPFILGWLLALLVYLDRPEPRRLFVATSILGIGFYSYIASMAMMPLYLAMTLFLLAAHKVLTPRSAMAAIAGFGWPLLLWIPWLVREPAFVADVLVRYSVDGVPRFRFSAIADRVTLYWTFFNPAFLFLIGGFTHLTATTRLVGVFLLPFIVLIPLGLVQMVTVARGPWSVVLFAGFLLAPMAAVLTVQEPYASSRQLPILVFGVIIATYGVQRALAWRAAAARALAIGVLALLPIHFAFFLNHYFGAYHEYSAAPFEWNHGDALAAIIARNPPDRPQPVFLTTTREQWMDAYWKLALASTRRQDLLAHTTYFDSTKMATLDSIPASALVLVTVDDKKLLEAVTAGEFAEVMRFEEPADEPVFFLLRRVSIQNRPATGDHTTKEP